MVSGRFRSRYEHTIDDKGRLSFPSRYREVLRQHESETLVAIPWEDHLRIYPLSEWELLENRLRAEEREQLEGLDKVLRYFQSESYECVLDRQGRLLLPPSLRADLGLQRDVVLIGMVDHVEIWGQDVWSRERNLGRDQFREQKARIKKKGII